MRPNLPAFFADLAPLAVYYGAEAVWGEVTALILSILWVGGETAWLLYRRRPLTAFFLFSSAVTILFGAADLIFRGPDLLRYEPVALNTLLAAFFLAARLLGGRLLQEMAATQGRVLPPFDPQKAKYFRTLIYVWASYFAFKACTYYWVAKHLDRPQLLALRFFLGNGSAVALAALSVAGLRIVGKQSQRNL